MKLDERKMKIGMTSLDVGSQREGSIKVDSYLKPETQRMPLMFMENRTGRRETSDLSSVLTALGKALYSSPGVRSDTKS